MLSWGRQERAKLIAEAEALKAVADRDGTAQSLKNCALAWVNIADDFYDDADVEIMKDAVLMLERVSVMEPEDYDTKLQLAMAYFSLFLNDFDAGEVICRKSLDYFLEVKREAPHIYDDSGYIEAVQEHLPSDMSTFETERTMAMDTRADWLKLIETKLCPRYYTPLEIVNSVEMLKELMTIQRHEKACEDAERRYAEDPKDSESLRNWGCALVSLTFYYGSYFITEALPKLKAAVEINPEDSKAKYEYANACMSAKLCFGTDEISAFERLKPVCNEEEGHVIKCN